MPSFAKSNFDSQLLRCDFLINQAGKLKKHSLADAKQIFLHAALAAQVASWDAYVKNVVEAFYTAISNPTDQNYNNLHILINRRKEAAKKKLNTPNSSNCRNYLIDYCDYDPWSDWVNIRFGNNLFNSSLLVRDRLDEVLKLRHSFAHGVSMPIFQWCNSQNGNAVLDVKTIRAIKRFINEIVIKTDDGISSFIAMKYSIARPW